MLRDPSPTTGHVPIGLLEGREGGGGSGVEATRRKVGLGEDGCIVLPETEVRATVRNGWQLVLQKEGGQAHSSARGSERRGP